MKLAPISCVPDDEIFMTSDGARYVCLGSSHLDRTNVRAQELTPHNMTSLTWVASDVIKSFPKDTMVLV